MPADGIGRLAADDVAQDAGLHTTLLTVVTWLYLSTLVRILELGETHDAMDSVVRMATRNEIHRGGLAKRREQHS